MIFSIRSMYTITIMMLRVTSAVIVNVPLSSGVVTVPAVEHLRRSKTRPLACRQSRFHRCDDNRAGAGIAHGDTASRALSLAAAPLTYSRPSLPLASLSLICPTLLMSASSLSHLAVNHRRRVSGGLRQWSAR